MSSEVYDKIKIRLKQRNVFYHSVLNPLASHSLSKDKMLKICKTMSYIWFHMNVTLSLSTQVKTSVLLLSY